MNGQLFQILYKKKQLNDGKVLICIVKKMENGNHGDRAEAVQGEQCMVRVQ